MNKICSTCQKRTYTEDSDKLLYLFGVRAYACEMDFSWSSLHNKDGKPRACNYSKIYKKNAVHQLFDKGGCRYYKERKK